MASRLQEIKERLNQALTIPIKRRLEEFNYNRTTINRWLSQKNDREPPASLIACVSELTSLSCDQLLLGKEIPGEVLDEEEKKVMEFWHRLTDADRDAFLRMLDRVAHKEEIIQSLGGSARPKAARAGGG